MHRLSKVYEEMNFGVNMQEKNQQSIIERKAHIKLHYF